MTRSTILLTVIAITGCQNQPDQAAGDDNPTSVSSMEVWTATRSVQNPLLTTTSPGMVAEHGYRNVNGPSVIRVPEWVDEPLGRYYMYFAHHRGSFIRLAYADSVEGPWAVSEIRVLELENAPALDHIASPDVHVDSARKQILMYFHSVDDTTNWVQTTYVAVSTDGLHFVSRAEPLGPPYMRVFKTRSDNGWWAIAKVRGGPGGVLLRSESAHGPFVKGPRIIPGMRHAAVLPDDNLAHIFFSRIGDRPERLLVTTIDPKQLWEGLTEPIETGSTIQEVMRPEMDYEGVGLPIEPSQVGEADRPVHALRDPAIFSEKHTYLFYSVAGESGIGVALLDR